MMRITNSMMIAQSLRNQNTNLTNMNKWNMDLNAMTNLHKPSDDPVKVGRTLRLQSDISLGVQYSDNLDSAKSWLESTESALSEVNQVMQRIREITVQGANGVLQGDDKQKIAQEISQLREHLINTSNQTYTGRHIFSGYKSNEPFSNSDGSYNPNLEELGLEYSYMQYKVGTSQNIDVNYTGDRIFGKSFGTAVINSSRTTFSTDAAANPSGKSVFDFSIDIEEAKKQLDPFTNQPVKGPDGKPVYILPSTAVGTITIAPATEYRNGDLQSVADDMNSQLPAAYQDSLKFVVDKDRIALITKDLNIKITVNEETQATTTAADPAQLGSIGFETTPAAASFIEAVQPIKPMFDMLTELQDKLESGDSEGVSDMLDDVDAHLQNILQIRGELGAKINMVDIMQVRIEDTTLSIKDLLSKTRDTDMGEAIMQLSTSEAVYKASLAVSARIIQPTLIDFLR